MYDPFPHFAASIIMKPLYEMAGKTFFLCSVLFFPFFTLLIPNPCMSSLPVPACLPGLFYNLIKTTPQSTVHTSLLYPFNLQTVNKSLS